jgi:DNA-binding protein
LTENQKVKPTAPPRQTGILSDTIFIGQKPLMSYVTAIVMQFNSGSKELVVKARGRLISQAVDVVEVCRRRFFADKLDIKEIKIGTEVLGGEGQSRNVSTIEIKLAKKD